MIYDIVKDVIQELELADHCEDKLKRIIKEGIERRKNKRRDKMLTPNEAWEKTPNMTYSDTQKRRTVSMNTDLFEFALERYPELNYNSLSEYIRWLIIYDERFGLLNPKRIAKMELELNADPMGDRPSFWQKKRFQ